MKAIITLSCMFLPFTLLSQQLDSLGLGDNRILNRQEYTFLNSYLSDRGDFDFKGKRVAFVAGTTGNVLITKKEFFDKFGHPPDEAVRKRNCSLIVLTPAEKDRAGGYDAIILTPVKVFTDKHKNRLLNQLKDAELSHAN